MIFYLLMSYYKKKLNQFNKAINKNKNILTDQNIFIFGIKPSEPSSEFGYFVSKKIRKNINKVVKFIEKPTKLKAKLVIKKKGYWNSGMFFLRKDSIIYNFKKYSPTIYKHCVNAAYKAKLKNHTYYLNKTSFTNSELQLPSLFIGVGIQIKIILQLLISSSYDELHSLATIS